MGWFLDGKVSRRGRQPHARADGRRALLPGGTAFLTDAGMCGPIDSVIGVTAEQVHRAASSPRCRSASRSRPGPCVVQGAVIDVDEATRPGHGDQAGAGVRRRDDAPREQLARLARGTREHHSRGGAARPSSTSGRPLRVKLGVDPTAPDIHLGHTVVLTKLRAVPGPRPPGGADHRRLHRPDRRSERPLGDPAAARRADEVAANAATYQEQVFKVLDRERTEVRCNGEWLGALRVRGRDPAGGAR